MLNRKTPSVLFQDSPWFFYIYVRSDYERSESSKTPAEIWPLLKSEFHSEVYFPQMA